MNKFNLNTIYHKHRPLSWSAISSFAYRPSDWYSRYILNEGSPASPEMLFGKKVGEKLASDPSYLPHIERLPIFEQKLTATFSDIPLIGYVDSCDPENNKLLEYKTGRKKWDQKRADNHGQIDMYLLMLYIQHKIHPEKMDCAVIWMPTHINDGAVAFIDENKIFSFKTKRTMRDVLAFGQRIEDTWKKMEEYAALQLSLSTSDPEEW